MDERLMTDDERRAEIEAARFKAAAEAIAAHNGYRDDELREGAESYLEEATIAVQAADRVRDARGDDEGTWLRAFLGDETDQWQLVQVDPESDGWRRAWFRRKRHIKAARSPQGEEHEAGIIERWECGRCGAEVREGKRSHFCGAPYPLKVTTDIRRVRYARVSPSRDGTVAEAERWLRERDTVLACINAYGEERLHDALRATWAFQEPTPARDGSVAVEDVVAWLRSVDGGLQHGWAKKAADAIEREFSPASTGDREKDR